MKKNASNRKSKCKTRAANGKQSKTRKQQDDSSELKQVKGILKCTAKTLKQTNETVRSLENDLLEIQELTQKENVIPTREKGCIHPNVREAGMRLQTTGISDMLYLHLGGNRR